MRQILAEGTSGKNKPRLRAAATSVAVLLRNEVGERLVEQRYQQTEYKPGKLKDHCQKVTGCGLRSLNTANHVDSRFARLAHDTC